MKDILGNEINVGDMVVSNPPYYKGLIKGKVVALTPKKVRVEYTTYRETVEDFLTFARDVVVV